MTTTPTPVSGQDERALRLAICDLPIPEGSKDYKHGFVTGKSAVLDLLTERAPVAAPAPASADTVADELAVGMLVYLAHLGASPAALSLGVQLFGIEPCIQCGFVRRHCRCLAAPLDAQAGTSEKIFEIWGEGYADNGTKGRKTDSMLLGRQAGIDFADACRRLAARDSAFAKYFDAPSLRFWDCKLYPGAPASGQADTTASATGQELYEEWRNRQFIGFDRHGPWNKLPDSVRAHWNAQANNRRAPAPSHKTAVPPPPDRETRLHGFDREDLGAIADGLESGYEASVNVGGDTGFGDVHIDSTTMAAARFIRAALADKGAQS
jgi:hypothetical protein